jgi:Fe-S-cluster-containing hydrogenase component 2
MRWKDWNGSQTMTSAVEIEGRVRTSVASDPRRRQSSSPCAGTCPPEAIAMERSP